jgi:ABC-2 type transport system ATP-binding protein
LCDHIALLDKSRKILEGSKKQVKDQFKSNTFIIDHRGSFSLNGGPYELLSQVPGEADLLKSTVRMINPRSPNDLIRDLIPLTELHSFQEKIPTMSDIFISLVKGEQHE